MQHPQLYPVAVKFHVQLPLIVYSFCNHNVLYKSLFDFSVTGLSQRTYRAPLLFILNCTICKITVMSVHPLPTYRKSGNIISIYCRISFKKKSVQILGSVRTKFCSILSPSWPMKTQPFTDIYVEYLGVGSKTELKSIKINQI